MRIVVGKEAVSESRDSIMTTINAYERLFMDPRLGPNRTLLQSCNLNEYIEANLVYDKDRNLAEEDDLLNTVTPPADWCSRERGLSTTALSSTSIRHVC